MKHAPRLLSSVMVARSAWFALACMPLGPTVCAQPCHVPLALQSVSGISTATVAIESPRNDPSRVYFMAQNGQIRLRLNGNVLANPVLSIPGYGSAGAGYGMAIDPAFASNGFIYFFGPITGGSQIVRYTRGVAADPEAFDPASRAVILTVPFSPSQHSGGWLGFGPEGYLYCALGEGNGNNAQNAARREGKVLRIDAKRDDFPADANNNFGVPADNPFPTGPWLPEVYIVGTRNPWRCSFDRATGTFFVADVGGGSAEEINIVPVASPGGMNFGWPCFEGLTPRSTTCAPFVHSPPAVDFPRSGSVSISCITGGYVYRGSAIPRLQGRYLFGSCGFGGNQRIFSIDPARPASSVRWHAQPQPSVLCFGEDSAGELYIGTTTGASKLVAGAPSASDCNMNSILDSCEIAAFEETDFNSDTIPDSCQRACLADFNASGSVTLQDLFDYLSTWFAARPAADLTHDGAIAIGDIFLFLDAWFAGCT